MTVRVVTDSTADLPPQTAEELRITIVPALVMFGHEEFRDGVDLTTEQFFEKMTKTSVAPTTSQAAVGAFLEVYEKLSKETDEIASIHLGGRFSGMVATALMARDALKGPCRIEVVDSDSASLGLGFAVMAAARAARDGAPMERVVAIARSWAERQHTFAMLDTLEWARRGGRIGRVEATLGNLLNLKPIVSVKGVVQPVSRARTRAGGLKRMFDLAMSYPNITHVGVMYATTPEDAEMIAEWVRTSLPDAQLEIVRTGPALGAHGGPGIMGMTVVEGEKEA